MMYLAEEILWGNTDNEWKPSILHRFDSEKKRSEFIDSQKTHKFSNQHKYVLWEAQKTGEITHER